MKEHLQQWQPNTCKCVITEMYDLDIQGTQSPTLFNYDFYCDKHVNFGTPADTFARVLKENLFVISTMASVKASASSDAINFAWSYNADNTILTIEYDDNTGHQTETYNVDPVTPVNTNGTN